MSAVDPAAGIPLLEATRGSGAGYTREELEISEGTYAWSVRLFSVFRKLLRVDLRLHRDRGAERALAEGDIFLFNHFSRFETFIPQYLIYQSTGALCRSIAASEFFSPGDPLTSYLLRVGAVPNNLPGLLPFLAREILRGRKIIVFPEGGMVKDRRVVDPDGEYRVYSRTAHDRRKHHTGAAVLGLMLDVFKLEVLRRRDLGDAAGLERLAADTDLALADLLAACERPTTIVPANITFYPLRVSDNVLRRAAELLGTGLSPRMAEELLIEGNILFKDTDMDIQLGEPLHPAQQWRWWERPLVRRFADGLDGLDGLFDLDFRGSWRQRYVVRSARTKVLRIRDAYMHRMYAAVTVNLSHLASRLILMLVDRERYEIPVEEFHRTLYLGVKALQRHAAAVRLHASVTDPDVYGDLVDPSRPPARDAAHHGIGQLLETEITDELVQRVEGRYCFLPKLLEEHTFDEIRLENLVVVYANEVAPIRPVTAALEEALAAAPPPAVLARARLDDQLRTLRLDRRAFDEPRHAEINAQETATEDPAPFLLLPPGEPRPLGILLVHGFLASPAEVHGFADRLHALSYPVLAVRLKGHGTSPWDLRERSRADWLESVREGYSMLAGLTDRICIVGFSTGGALALAYAASRPPGLAGVVSIAAPLRYRNRAMIFVPLVHGANQVVRWVSSWEGVMPFRVNESENPHVNYRHIPIRGIYELRRLSEELQDRLGDVDCPVLVLQGDRDPVVDPRSAEVLRAALPPATTTVRMVSSERHGILYRDIGGTHGLAGDFIASLENGGRPAPHPALLPAPG